MDSSTLLEGRGPVLIAHSASHPLLKAAAVAFTTQISACTKNVDGLTNCN